MKMNFKRTGAILLACAMVGGTLPPYAGVSFGTAITANAAATGQGTEDSPFIVTTYDELKELISPSDALNHIKTVDITINEPKAGQPVSFSAKTDDPDHVTTYTILNERRRYNRIDSWLEYDFLNKKDVPVYEGATFKAGKTYTAKFKIMTTDSDDVFSDDLKVTVNGKDVKNLEVSSTYATFCTTYNVKSTALKGDVNNDGIINVTDITKIAAHIKNKKKLNEEEQKRADVNNDGRINVTDITKIAAHIKGKKLLN